MHSASLTEDSIMKRLPKTSIILAGLCLVGAGQPAEPYSEGQVWEYRTRPADEGSLLRIQKIENSDNARIGTIYHISVIGVHFGNASQLAGTLGHLPVSGASLDASVTRLATRKVDFPDATSGIAQWRDAKGGVFTIPIAQIVASIELTFTQPAAPAPSK